jgi:hypothetical protein
MLLRSLDGLLSSAHGSAFFLHILFQSELLAPLVNLYLKLFFSIKNDSTVNFLYFFPDLLADDDL